MVRSISYKVALHREHRGLNCLLLLCCCVGLQMKRNRGFWLISIVGCLDKLVFQDDRNLWEPMGMSE